MLLVPTPTINWASRSTQTAEQASTTAALLLGGERRGLTGGAEGDDAGGTGVEVPMAEPGDRVERDAAVGRERRDHREVDAAEAQGSRHGPRVPAGPA